MLAVVRTQPLSPAVSDTWNTNRPNTSLVTVIGNYKFVYLSLSEGVIYFTKSFQLCSYYLRVAAIQGWHLIEEAWYAFEYQ